jgi:hypothetical protein
MSPRTVAQNLAMMAVFLGIGMTTFTENVRTVQVLGLYASGLGSGVFLARAILAARAARSGASGK